MALCAAGQGVAQVPAPADYRSLVDAYRRGESAALDTRYLLTYSPRDVPASGWHALDVKLKNRRGQVRARRGYLP